MTRSASVFKSGIASSSQEASSGRKVLPSSRGNDKVSGEHLWESQFEVEMNVHWSNEKSK